MFKSTENVESNIIVVHKLDLIILKFLKLKNW